VQLKRVLVADHQGNSRELLRILLEHEGCEVAEARDGLEAVAMARSTLPDLILLDLQLPGLDGWATAREMRRDRRLRNRSIVALTGSPGDDNVDRLHDAGFSGEIAKPIVTREFNGKLTEFLGARLHSRQGR
jgi:CheY-like chemotaxis protein